jgi:hypothetical protein
MGLDMIFQYLRCLQGRANQKPCVRGVKRYFGRSAPSISIGGGWNRRQRGWLRSAPSHSMSTLAPRRKQRHRSAPPSLDPAGSCCLRFDRPIPSTSPRRRDSMVEHLLLAGGVSMARGADGCRGGPLRLVPPHRRMQQWNSPMRGGRVFGGANVRERKARVLLFLNYRLTGNWPA